MNKDFNEFLPEVEDRNWQDAEMARDEAFRRHEVEEAFRLIVGDWKFMRGEWPDDACEASEQDWELLAQALEDRFPGFLKFYRSL